eukprot:TRINITY_DN1767_c0_g2_i1.p1 TRINITY_DN1767_c0_g2~~TRINITY_DN1767_c0_g2_i1.p1  ORF type:complete len:303 (+),score=57.19 TRINITY_DN1767_c0_g2_i1:306-1214(+)
MKDLRAKTETDEFKAKIHSYLSPAKEWMEKLNDRIEAFDDELKEYKGNDASDKVSRNMILRRLTANYNFFKAESPRTSERSKSPLSHRGRNGSEMVNPLSTATQTTRRMTVRNVFASTGAHTDRGPERESSFRGLDDDGYEERMKALTKRVEQLQNEQKVRGEPHGNAMSTPRENTHANDQLIIMERMRKTMIRELKGMKFTGDKTGNLAMQKIIEIKNQLIPKEKEIYRQKMLDEEKKKKYHDMLSRKPFSSAYYQLVAMSPESKSRLKKRLGERLSENSRLKEFDHAIIKPVVQPTYKGQ